MLWILCGKKKKKNNKTPHIQSLYVSCYPFFFALLSLVCCHLSILSSPLVRPASMVSHSGGFKSIWTHAYLSESFSYSSSSFPNTLLPKCRLLPFFLFSHTFHGMRLLSAFCQVCREEKQTETPEPGMWSLRLLIMFSKHNHRLLIMLTSRVDDDILKKNLELS